jgi:hypothetical protein
MMALRPIILFVTTDIYEKVTIRQLSCKHIFLPRIWAFKKLGYGSRHLLLQFCTFSLRLLAY